MNVYYFAYGSCMDQIDFRRTIKKFDTLGPAILKDYRLSFSLYGQSRGGGVADVIPSKGEVVEGVLYRFPLKHLADLDIREGVHLNVYERLKVQVEHYGQSITVYTYQVLQKAETEWAPSQEYVHLMLNGMNTFCSATYTRQFKRRLKEQFGTNLKD